MFPWVPFFCWPEKLSEISSWELKGTPLEKGNRDKLARVMNVLNVPPFLSLISDGRGRNDIEVGGLEW